MAEDLDDRNSFFSGAEAYEQYMGRWSRVLAPLLVRFAGVRDGDAVLEVGSGTGAVAAAVASAAPASRIVGIDPAGPLVAFAQSRQSNDHVSFEVGDAQQMRFDDGVFDRTLALLVLNFVPDPERALREMKRVTRRGGTIAAAVWDYGAGMEMLRVFWDAAIGLQPADDARDERHMRFSRRGELADLWRSEGLQNIVDDALTIETGFISFDDYWTPFTKQQGPAGAYVAALPAVQREALKLQLRHHLLGDGPDRPLTLHATAWAVRGAVP
jgi:SAM-dependent methyltransferase